MDPATEEKKFHPDMSVADAHDVHRNVAQIFAAFHLGACSHCGIAAFETIEQVCAAYGVELDVFLDTLEKGFPQDS